MIKNAKPLQRFDLISGARISKDLFNFLVLFAAPYYGNFKELLLFLCMNPRTIQQKEYYVLWISCSKDFKYFVGCKKFSSGNWHLRGEILAGVDSEIEFIRNWDFCLTVEALERLYHECPKPNSLRRQQLIRECPILCNIEPKQIKVWFQNRRCREKQRKEACRLQAVNRKLTAMNKLLMEENDRLQKQVSHLVYENGYFRQHTQNKTPASKDTSCESMVTSGQHHLAPQHPPRDASPAGLLSIAEETLTEFLSKATGTAVEWIQMPGMKPGPDSIGIVAISHGCAGVAARTCGLVGLEPTRVAEILKDRPSWFRECRVVDVLNVLPTANGGTIELLYMQLYAPTTLAPARDFWLLRYSSVMEDGSLVVCERSLNNTQNGPSVPPVQNFVRAEMLPSGYLIRPCEGGGSIMHIVYHMDLEPWSVPEVLRLLYESSTMLAQKTTMAALRHLRQIALEVSQPNVSNWGRRPTALRALSQRLSRGFNEALNGFTDEGWSRIGNDGMDDVTILVNSSPEKLMGLNLSYANGFPAVSNPVLCAKASMLLQNVQPAVLLRFMREHRSEWSDDGIDAYSTVATRVGPCSLPGSQSVGFSNQVIFPLAHTMEHEELLEVIKLEGIAHCHEDTIMPRDIFLLQLCSGMDESAVGTCAELIFAPIDASFADDAPLLPSGFRIIPLDFAKEGSSPKRTLDFASALEIGPAGIRLTNNHLTTDGNMRSVMTIAFQFAFDSHLQDNVASMARQYVRNIIASVQRVALALSPSNLSSHASLRSPLGTPEAHTLARWIYESYRCFLGVELLKMSGQGNDFILQTLWHHSDAIMCCSLKVLPVFIFANQAGLDMLETTLVALQDIALDKILDDHGQKALYSEFPQIMQQGFACLQGGIFSSSMGRPVSYERAVAWKVLNEEENAHCICFMFVNWTWVFTYLSFGKHFRRSFFRLVTQMEAHSEKEDVCLKLLDLIPKDSKWLLKRDEERSHGLSDEKKLELRLGLPGDEDNWFAKNNPKIVRKESLLSLRHFSSIAYSNNSNNNHSNISQRQQQVFPTPRPCSSYQHHHQNQSAKILFPQCKTRPTAAKQSSQPCCTRMAELQNAENTAVSNSSQKRAAPAAVVGWPPLRSFRKNIAASGSTKLSPEPQSTIPSKIANEKPVENRHKGLFVKINMDGVPIGRKVDLNAYDSYEKLSSAVDELFRGLLAAQRDPSAGGNQEKQKEKEIAGSLDGSGEYTLVYEDHEGDIILVGDVPWHMFQSNVKRLRVLKSSDLPTLYNRWRSSQGKIPIQPATK
ncbi:hypothetical protein Nepgr_017834 [Nepenthes gracilis]|uniref:Auxin-responsive protein n=1 Tax=Nepenthes gracilis TaxID=150966 RepID=A0AAD3SQ45_NEPGR|nr:hypothetical protein Nepgr_017834 [Nepenthes gracilis]